MHRFFLTKSTTPIIGWIASLLGLIMSLLYSGMNIHNIGVCIIIFTFVVNIIMLPMTIKQQKTQKITSVMQPELAAIQAKYRNKNDQQSMARMQAETKAVYDKYGTSMTGGCAQLLIQMPILFALYQVIYRIPAYVPEIRALFETVAQPVIDEGLPALIAEGNETIAAMVKAARMGTDFTGNEINSVIDFLYKLTPEQWETMKGFFPNLSEAITKVATESVNINTFFGMNLSMSPWQGLKPNLAWIIPILAGLTQWYSTYLMTKDQPKTDPNDQTAATMKAMNTTMPLMSVFFCFTFPTAIGVYWVASSVARMLIQIGVNKKLSSVDVAQIVEQNIAKTNQKRAKKGLPPIRVDQKTIENVANSDDVKEKEERQTELRRVNSERHIEASNEYYNLNADPKSLTARANMVLLYNQRQEELRRGKKGGKKSEVAKPSETVKEDANAETEQVNAADVETKEGTVATESVPAVVGTEGSADNVTAQEQTAEVKNQCNESAEIKAE